MQSDLPGITIETLVLVAIWNQPSIFQGSFQITNQHDGSTLILFFRCECNLENETLMLEEEFIPTDYKFTHLFNHLVEIDVDKSGSEIDLAFYLLKFSLKVTLEKMIHHPSQYLAYMDEVAMTSIAQQINEQMFNQQQGIIDDTLGFAVSMDFTSTESIGQLAAVSLLKIAHYGAAHQLNYA